MILVDANILLHAYNPSAERHAAARVWLENVLGNPEPVRVSWTGLLAFLRIATSPRVFRRPLTTAEASRIVSEWFEQPAFDVLHPTERHWSILQGLLDRGQARGPLVVDAHLAALGIEHGATVCTSDRDFAKFPGLKLDNPLETPPR